MQNISRNDHRYISQGCVYQCEILGGVPFSDGNLCVLMGYGFLKEGWFLHDLQTSLSEPQGLNSLDTIGNTIYGRVVAIIK